MAKPALKPARNYVAGWGDPLVDALGLRAAHSEDGDPVLVAVESPDKPTRGFRRLGCIHGLFRES